MPLGRVNLVIGENPLELELGTNADTERAGFLMEWVLAGKLQKIGGAGMTER
jgi:hypothetical protein